MQKSRFRQSLWLALFIGGMLALFVSLSTFWEMPHNWWLTIHNLLVIISLMMAALLGYHHGKSGWFFNRMLLSMAFFFMVIAFLYLTSYALTTRFLAGKMAWIPFFYHDFNYHGFKSVWEYLNHKNNYRELLELQVFSFLIGSVMYFAAGSLGYAFQAVLQRTGRKQVSEGSAN